MSEIACRQFSGTRLVPAVLFLALAALCAAGCQPSHAGPPLVPVEGTITLDGQPLAGATITFVPTGEGMGQSSFAASDDQGHFVLKTAEGHPGAVAGAYKVVISRWLNPDGSVFVATPEIAPIDSSARESLPAAYSNYDQSQLTANVAAGAPPLEFKLDSKAR